MGWSFCPNHKKKSDCVNERIQAWETDTHKGRTLKHCCVGNVLWTVRENIDKATNKAERYIGCDLLQNGGDGHGWGYKDMCESMGPYYFSCPLPYLDMAPEADATWRKRVRAHHAIQKHTLNVGDVVKAAANVNVKGNITIVSIKPLTGTDQFGNRWRLKRRHIDIGLPTPESILSPDEQQKQDLLDAGKSLRCSASSCNDAGDLVHVLFSRKDGSTEGWYMHQDTYHAFPLGEHTTPDDYRKHGELRAAPATYGNGSTTKEVSAAEFLAMTPAGIPQLQAA